MRLFFAIEIPEEIMEKIKAVQKTLMGLGSGVKWTNPKGIHCTLKFLGEVDESLVNELVKAARSVSTIKPFSIDVSKAGVFPTWSNPRVIWLGISPIEGPLHNLQQKIESQVAPLGFEPENRAYRPHLTLGRVKSKNNLNRIIKYIRDGSDTLALGKFEVESFNLYQSILHPQGAEYRGIEKIFLRGN